MAACGAPHACRVEISAFYEDVGGGFRYAAVHAAEYSGYAHWLLCVAYHQVGVVQRAFGAVERGELRPFGTCTHHDFAS